MLCVGNCRPDHAALAGLLEQQFAGAVQRADTAPAARAALRSTHFAVVLVNRVLDADGSSGIELVHRLHTDHPDVPILLISNYGNAQHEAIAAGAHPGFGKRDLHNPATIELLAQYLPRRD